MWSLAHSEDVPAEIIDQALGAHIKILDYSASQVAKACCLFFQRDGNWLVMLPVILVLICFRESLPFADEMRILSTRFGLALHCFAPGSRGAEASMDHQTCGRVED